VLGTVKVFDMTRISVLTDDQTPEAARPLLESVNSAYGMVPNVFKVLAHSPSALGTYLQFHQANETTSLTAKQRETISLAVSQINGCEYCSAVHSFVGSKVGLTESDIISAREGHLDAYARFAHAVVSTRGHISNEMLAEARSQGLSDAVLIEIISQITLLVFTNLVNNVAQTTLDFPPVKM
jgi:uncharacterized peroxidase-related enzyme